MIAQAPTFAHYMQEGHDALQHDEFDRALDRFRLAESEAEGHTALAEARKMIGVCLRLLGYLGKAEESLKLALESARKQDDQRVLCAALRDLGEVYHDQALRFVDSVSLRKWAFEEAADAFRESIEIAHDADLFAEETTTLSFWGMSVFEQGNKKGGRTMLRWADAQFRKFDAPVYEANHVIRLMRCSFGDRWKNLPRALRLTSKNSVSPGSRSKVIAALFGNTAFLAAKAYRQRM